MSQNGGAGGSASPKPDPEAPKKHINIVLKDDKESEVHFKIKFTTPLSKVIAAYCERQGVTKGSLRFFFDNVRINEGDTPASLEMEENDLIDVHQEQQGGGELHTEGDTEEVKPIHMSIKVKDQSGSDIDFRIKNTTPLGKVMTAYCKTKEIDAKSVRFLHDGIRLTTTDTALSREMEDGETIQAMVEQLGGS